MTAPDATLLEWRIPCLQRRYLQTGLADSSAFSSPHLEAPQTLWCSPSASACMGSNMLGAWLWQKPQAASRNCSCCDHFPCLMWRSCSSAEAHAKHSFLACRQQSADPSWQGEVPIRLNEADHAPRLRRRDVIVLHGVGSSGSFSVTADCCRKYIRTKALVD